MRQVFLEAPGPQGPRLDSLDQTEEVWVAGYPRVMTLPGVRPLHIFWRHYYGASAQVTWSGATLALLLEDLDVVLPACAALPAVQAFLQALAALCRRALRHGLVLQVVAD